MSSRIQDIPSWQTSEISKWRRTHWSDRLDPATFEISSPKYPYEPNLTLSAGSKQYFYISYPLVEEQIIPSKTKFSSIQQYNPRKPKKWGFQNLAHAGSSGIMYDFFIYEGKPKTNNEHFYDHLQNSAQVVAKLCENLSSHKKTINCFLIIGFLLLN